MIDTNIHAIFDIDTPSFKISTLRIYMNKLDVVLRIVFAYGIIPSNRDGSRSISVEYVLVTRHLFLNESRNKISDMNKTFSLDIRTVTFVSAKDLLNV